jgi:hypothetical protein
MLTGLSIPHDKRIKGLLVALALGVIAVFMEIYQLASQYFGCE